MSTFWVIIILISLAIILSTFYLSIGLIHFGSSAQLNNFLSSFANFINSFTVKYFDPISLMNYSFSFAVKSILFLSKRAKMCHASMSSSRFDLQIAFSSCTYLLSGSIQSCFPIFSSKTPHWNVFVANALMYFSLQFWPNMTASMT